MIDHRRCSFALVLLSTWGALGACTSTTQTEAGVAIDVWISADPSEGDSATFNTDRGLAVSVDRAAVVDGWIDVAPCPAVASNLSPTDRLLRWFLPTAEAHPTSASLRLAAPVFASMIPGQPMFKMGALKLPAGRYCFVTITIAPADLDTLGLPPTPPSVGTSVFVRGTVTGPDVAEAQPFEATSSASIEIATAISPVVVDASHRQAAIVVTHHPRSWFDGVDWTVPIDEAIAAALLENVRRATTVSVLANSPDASMP